MKKGMILLAVAMVAGCLACNAQIKKNSETAANQAKEGKTTQAANTASKTMQSDRFSTSTPGNSNLHDYVSKKADEARAAAERQNNNTSSSSNDNKNSTSGTSSNKNSTSGTSSNSSSNGNKNGSSSTSQSNKNK